jgi:hypothetical protein
MRDSVDALWDEDASGVMFWMVTWTSGIADEGLDDELRGFLAGPQSKLRQWGGL